MIERLEALDEFFKLIIEDGLGRFVFCHIPFWSFFYWLFWNIGAYLGPYILFGVVFLVIPSLFFAGILFEIYKHNEERSFKRFKIAVPIYLGILLGIVGIPYVYFGAFLSFVSDKDVNDFSWGFIKYWWAFLNHIQPFKDVVPPWKLYEYTYSHLQILLLAVALIVTPFFFYNFFESDKRKIEEAKKEMERLEEEELAEKRVIEQERIREENWRRRQEEEARAKRGLELAKQQKLNETKAQDPWDSGFL